MYLIYILLHIIEVVLDVRRTHSIALTKPLVSIALTKPLRSIALTKPLRTQVVLEVRRTHSTN